MEISEVKRHAAGRWAEIVGTLAGVNGETLSGRHQPCPRCGGTDRFRAFGDFDQTGGCICNQCGKFADGFATVQWLTGQDFPAVSPASRPTWDSTTRRRRRADQRPGQSARESAVPGMERPAGGPVVPP